MDRIAVIKLVRSRFYRFQPALSIAEIGAKLVDLGDVICKCDNPELRKSIAEYMGEIGVTAMEKSRTGDFTFPTVIAEVKVRDANGLVKDGIVCIAPSCLCEAVREVWQTDPELAAYVRVPVAPLDKVYDLTKPGDEVELKAMVAGVCRGEGNREIIKAFAKYYIIKKAMEDPRFRKELIAWLSAWLANKDGDVRMPPGLLSDLMSFLKDLGLDISKSTVNRALYEIREKSAIEILSSLGIKVEEIPQLSHVDCVRPELAQSILKKLGLQHEYLGIICALTERDIERLHSLVSNDEEFKDEVKGLLVKGNISADDLRRLMEEHLSKVGDEDKTVNKVEGPEVSEAGEVEVPIETGKSEVETGEGVKRPGVKVEAKPEVGRGVLRGGAAINGLRARTIVGIEVNCVGPNADEADECRFVRAAADLAMARGDAVEFFELLDIIASRVFVAPLKEEGDYAYIRGTITRLLRAYGIKHVDKIVELYTPPKPNKLLDDALGGDFQSLIEYLKLVVEKAMGNANGESREALRNLHMILSGIAQLDPGALNEYAWVLIDAINAIRGRFSWGTHVVGLATQLNLDPEIICTELAEAGRRKRNKGETSY
jgi:hypothetical protein